MSKREALEKLNDVLDQMVSERKGTNSYIKERLQETVELTRLSHTARKMLDILAQHGEEMNQRTLAKRVGVTPQAISIQLKALEHRGLLVRVNGTQKNENLIALTEVGHKLGLVLNQAAADRAEYVLQDFTQEESAEFLALLCKIRPK